MWRLIAGGTFLMFTLLCMLHVSFPSHCGRRLQSDEENAKALIELVSQAKEPERSDNTPDVFDRIYKQLNGEVNLKVIDLALKEERANVETLELFDDLRRDHEVCAKALITHLNRCPNDNFQKAWKTFDEFLPPIVIKIALEFHSGRHYCALEQFLKDSQAKEAE